MDRIKTPMSHHGNKGRKHGGRRHGGRTNTRTRSRSRR